MIPTASNTYATTKTHLWQPRSPHVLTPCFAGSRHNTRYQSVKRRPSPCIPYPHNRPIVLRHSKHDHTARSIGWCVPTLFTIPRQPFSPRHVTPAVLAHIATRPLLGLHAGTTCSIIRWEWQAACAGVEAARRVLYQARPAFPVSQSVVFPRPPSPLLDIPLSTPALHILEYSSA